MRSLEGTRKGPENWVLKNLSISFISTYLNIWTNLNIRMILTLITQTQDNSLAEEYCAKIILAPLRCTVWVKWSIEHLTSLHPEIHPFKIHLSTKYSCLFFPSKKKMFLGSPCCRAAAGEAPGWLMAKRAPFIANLSHFGPMKGPQMTISGGENGPPPNTLCSQASDFYLWLLNRLKNLHRDQRTRWF